MLALNVNMIRGNEHRWMDCRQNLGRSNWQIGALGDPWGPLGTLGDWIWFHLVWQVLCIHRAPAFANVGPGPGPKFWTSTHQIRKGSHSGSFIRITN